MLYVFIDCLNAFVSTYVSFNHFAKLVARFVVNSQASVLANTYTNLGPIPALETGETIRKSIPKIHTLCSCLL